MSNLSAWAIAAGDNDTSPPDGWPEGMARSAVNDAAREMMAAIARFWNDLAGTLVTTGNTSAYALTTNSAHAALGDIGPIAFRANFTNSGPATLAVDGLTAKSIKKCSGVALSSGDIRNNQLVRVLYNPNKDYFEYLNAPEFGGSGNIKGVFYMAAPPTGWTQIAINDRVLRVMSSSTGVTGGSAWTISGLSVTVATHQLAIGEIPVGSTTAQAVDASGGTPDIGELWKGINAPASHGHPGSSVSHDGNWRPLTVDVVIASKD